MNLPPPPWTWRPLSCHLLLVPHLRVSQRLDLPATTKWPSSSLLPLLPAISCAFQLVQLLRRGLPGFRGLGKQGTGLVPHLRGGFQNPVPLPKWLTGLLLTLCCVLLVLPILSVCPLLLNTSRSCQGFPRSPSPTPSPLSQRPGSTALQLELIFLSSKTDEWLGQPQHAGSQRCADPRQGTSSSLCAEAARDVSSNWRGFHFCCGSFVHSSLGTSTGSASCTAISGPASRSLGQTRAHRPSGSFGANQGGVSSSCNRRRWRSRNGPGLRDPGHAGRLRRCSFGPYAWVRPSHRRREHPVFLGRRYGGLSWLPSFAQFSPGMAGTSSGRQGCFLLCRGVPDLEHAQSSPFCQSQSEGSLWPKACDHSTPISAASIPSRDHPCYLLLSGKDPTATGSVRSSCLVSGFSTTASPPSDGLWSSPAWCEDTGTQPPQVHGCCRISLLHVSSQLRGSLP